MIAPDPGSSACHAALDVPGRSFLFLASLLTSGKARASTAYVEEEGASYTAFGLHLSVTETQNLAHETKSRRLLCARVFTVFGLLR